MAWQKLSSVEKYKNRYMAVTEDELITDHGDKVIYGIVRKEPFSVVVPWDGAKLLLVGQYRPSAEIYSWEFPMGHAETDEPLEAAKRELLEETGLFAQDLTEIGRFYPALGTMNQKGYIYLARHWEQGQQHLDPAEIGMQQQWVSVEEFKALVADGTIADGPTITAYKFFELYLTKQSGV